MRLDEWGGGLVKEMKDRLTLFRNQMRGFGSRRDEQGVRQYNIARWEYLCLPEKQEIFYDKS